MKKKVLQRLTDYNVTLNDEKCIFDVEQIKFLGHILSSDGIHPTDDKIKSIKQFRQPKSMEEVRIFLGLVNYVGKFIPNLATITEPLRNLTKKDTTFEWNEEHEVTFEQSKLQLSNPMVLGYYNTKDRTMLFADASPVGLGSVLVQYQADEPHIISYASKSLSDTEKR